MGFFSRYVWLDSRMAEAVKSAYKPGQPGWDEFRFARAAAQDIKSLGDSGEGLCSAVLLARAVVDLLLRATLARAGSPVPTATPGNECWARWLEQPQAASATQEFSQEQRELIVSLLTEGGALALPQQSKAQLRLALYTLLDLKETLLEPLQSDATRIHRVRKQRYLILGLIALVVVFGSRALWHRITERPNLALHKRVTISTLDPQMFADTTGLVDGDRESLGMHTVAGPNQMAVIDLGAPHKISRVIVYNRLDCCQDRAVPLRIEVSLDGSHYQTVAQRKEVFQTSFTADFPKTNARYVKLTDLQATYFHLNEVEVY